MQVVNWPLSGSTLADAPVVAGILLLRIGLLVVQQSPDDFAKLIGIGPNCIVTCRVQYDFDKSGGRVRSIE